MAEGEHAEVVVAPLRRHPGDQRVTHLVDRRVPEPDPAEGSAGTSGRQSTFEGSDRQGRGRLVDALRLGPVATGALAETMGWPDDPVRAERVAATLLVDGLADVSPSGEWSLPTG